MATKEVKRFTKLDWDRAEALYLQSFQKYLITQSKEDLKVLSIRMQSLNQLQWSEFFPEIYHSVSIPCWETK